MAKVRAGQLRAGSPLLRLDMRSAEPLVLVWRVPDQARINQRQIVGFVADLSFVNQIFARIVSESPLLPPSLAGDTRTLLSVRVMNDDGRQVFASSPEWSEYASETVLDNELSALKLAVALQPSAAEALIIGGLPRNRLRLLVGLLVVTTGLVLIGVVQLRREHELARLRADFISGVSHELRTPLAQIRMFGETLLLNRVRSSSERHRSLAIIVQESQRLTTLIENVLHFSRVERGSSLVSRSPMRLDRLLHEILDSFDPLAQSKRASIARRIQEGVIVPVDAGAFRQVMLNLLDNAVKYGPAGQTITVAASCDQGTARIAVEDDGPGVPSEHVNRIWQPFYRVPGPAETTGGTGIGLAIVKQLVELHHGQVRIERGESAGARFVIELPEASRAEDVREWPKVVAAGP
jgi:signal transduction histidine kinase